MSEEMQGMSFDVPKLFIRSPCSAVDLNGAAVRWGNRKRRSGMSCVMSTYKRALSAYVDVDCTDSLRVYRVF